MVSWHLHHLIDYACGYEHRRHDSVDVSQAIIQALCGLELSSVKKAAMFACVCRVYGLCSMHRWKIGAPRMPFTAHSHSTHHAA